MYFEVDKYIVDTKLKIVRANSELNAYVQNGWERDDIFAELQCLRSMLVTYARHKKGLISSDLQACIFIPSPTTDSIKEPCPAA